MEKDLTYYSLVISLPEKSPENGKIGGKPFRKTKLLASLRIERFSIFAQIFQFSFTDFPAGTQSHDGFLLLFLLPTSCPAPTSTPFPLPRPNKQQAATSYFLPVYVPISHFLAFLGTFSQFPGGCPGPLLTFEGLFSRGLPAQA